MYIPAKHAAGLISILILLICNISCTQEKAKKQTGSNKKYSIYILAKDTKEYLLETDSLTNGTLYPEKQGAELNGKELDRDVIVKDGFYYHLSRKRTLFFKYKIVGKSFNEVGALPLPDFSIENYYWTDEGTLLLTGLNAKDFTQAKYVLIKTDEMEIIRSGNLDIPGPSGKYTSLSLGLTEMRQGQLLVGYTYHQQLNEYNYTTSDTAYVAHFDYPKLKLIKTNKETKSTYPGGANTIQPYSFSDEKGDYYFMTCPGIAMGNRPDLPTGIFRIKAGKEDIDKNYFFNVSSSIIKNHAYGIWYLGDNKAIIRNERRDLFKGLGDHYSTAHFEFHVIDLSTGKVLQKLDLPLDKGTRRACIIVKNNIAYISVNSSLEGNYIWLYDIKKGNLKKGLQLAGDTDFIMRIDEIN